MITTAVKRLLIMSVILAALTSAFGAKSPPPAKRVLAAAEGKALANHKNVLVIFGASWCGWCKRLDSFINTPDIRAIFTNNFVIAHLTVEEHGKMAVLDNPGGEALMAYLGGKQAGLPFFAILDPKGNLTVNSNRPNALCPSGTSNIGFPGNPAEFAWFATMLSKGAPAYSANDQRVVTAEFQKLYPRMNLTPSRAKNGGVSSGPVAGVWNCLQRSSSIGDVRSILNLKVQKGSVSGAATSCYGESRIEFGSLRGTALLLRLSDGTSVTLRPKGGALAGSAQLKTGKAAWQCRRPATQLEQ